ncbi:MAG TPA: peptidoglycan-binding protein [Chthoniobacterales bacterium]|nr:peptidoglycan-binding protein [Chthoniobacterales bacterium]
MNKLIYSALVGSLALAVSAKAADENDPPKKAKAAKKASTAQAASARTNRSAQGNVHRNSNAMHAQQKSLNTSRNNAGVTHQNKMHSNDGSVARQRGVNETAVQRNTAKNGLKNSKVDRSRNANLNSQQNVTVNRQKNITVVNNWSGSRFSGQQYAAFRNYRRERHDRNWWNSHYSRIVIFGGGSYYWNSGYWYPAWGYDSGYNYGYDGPIYGYNDLNPDQVVLNVQGQLQRNGYYSGPIDGSLGPVTRRAIAAFQADRGLAITSAIDQPTLATLGLV